MEKNVTPNLDFDRFKDDFDKIHDSSTKMTDDPEERTYNKPINTPNEKDTYMNQSHLHQHNFSEEQTMALKRIQDSLQDIDTKLNKNDERDTTILLELSVMKTIFSLVLSKKTFQEIEITNQLKVLTERLDYQRDMNQTQNDSGYRSTTSQSEVVEQCPRSTVHRNCLCHQCLRCYPIKNIKGPNIHGDRQTKTNVTKKNIRSSGGGPPDDDGSSSDEEDKDSRNDRDDYEPFHMRKEKRAHKKAGASGGNGSSDDPDSDEDKDDFNDKNRARKDGWGSERHRKSRTTKNVKGKAFSIDSEEWENCLHHRNFEKRAHFLLQKGKLPSKDILDEICTRYNRKSFIVKLICDHVCIYIQQKSKRIVFVWASYKYARRESSEYGNKIVFVVLTKEQEMVDCDFQVYQRNVHEIDALSKSENINISEQERTHCLTDEDKANLKKCITKNARVLMEKHSNLTRITLSSVKSTSQRNIQRLPCIAFYVQVKGYIPINEEPFKEKIENYLVDVRECVFRLHGKPADFHENVKMGCLFDTGYGTNQGTIGPFIQIERNSNYYCLTSSHIVLPPSEFERVKNKGFVHYGKSGIDVYQPPECVTYHTNQGKRYPLGRLEAAIYREGDHSNAGMEIALLKINDDRLPTDCKFPYIPPNSDFGEIGTALCYEKICGLSNVIDGAEVWKYGGCTELTKGYVRFDGSSLRTRTFNHPGEHDLTLYKQIEVHATEKFGDNGDSGSLVLINSNNELVALGIFEGSILDGSNNIYIVSPLFDITRAISETLPRYTPRHADQEDMDIECTSTIPQAIRIPNMQQNPEAGRNRPNDGTEIGTFRSTAEMEENIMFHTEHKINVVKTEISTVEKKLSEQIQTLDTNMKSLFEGQGTMLQQLLSKFHVQQNSNEQNGQN